MIDAQLSLTNFYNQKLETIQSLRELIKNQDVLKGVQKLLNENQSLNKQVAKMTQAQAGNIKGDLLKGMQTINGVNFISAQVDLDAKAIKNLAFELKKEQDNLLLGYLMFGLLAKLDDLQRHYNHLRWTMNEHSYQQ